MLGVKVHAVTSLVGYYYSSATGRKPPTLYSPFILTRSLKPFRPTADCRMAHTVRDLQAGPWRRLWHITLR